MMEERRGGGSAEQPPESDLTARGREQITAADERA
jgi:hypothetical protein